MLESWSLERLLVYQLLQESLALTAGVGTYTIGTGGAFNTSRPNKLADPCFTRDSANYDRPLILVDAQTYGRISLKSIGNTYPEYLFYDHAWTAGLGLLTLYPLPQASLTMYINSWKQLQSFAAIGTTLSLPPGYQRAIEFNLAIELAGGFGNVSAEVAKVARESKAVLKGLNAPENTLMMPIGVAPRRRWNINSGS
jgi:hypothetical protein